MEELLKKQKTLIGNVARRSLIWLFVIYGLAILILIISLQFTMDREVYCLAFLAWSVCGFALWLYTYLPSILASLPYKKCISTETEMYALTIDKVRCIPSNPLYGFGRRMVGATNFYIYGVKLYAEIDGVRKKFYYIFPEPIPANTRQPRELRDKFSGILKITLYSNTYAVAQVQETKET